MIQLTPRERWLALFGGGALILAMVYGFILKPVFSRTETLYRVLPEQQRDLAQLKQDRQTYTQLQAKMASIHQTYLTEQGTATLLPVLDDLLVRHQLKKKTSSLNPSASYQEGPYQVIPIALKLDNIQLKPLLNLFTDLQTTQPPLHVVTMHLQHAQNSPGQLDASITLHGLTLAKN